MGRCHSGYWERCTPIKDWECLWRMDQMTDMVTSMQRAGKGGAYNEVVVSSEYWTARLPDIIEACAFSVPDARLGELVGACVQLRKGAALNQQEIAHALTGQLAPFKIPAMLWTQTTPLLRGATDKIDRRGLRELCLDTQEKAIVKTGRQAVCAFVDLCVVN